MKFFIVGMGRAGSSLFFSLKKAGFYCTGYLSRRPHEDVDALYFSSPEDVPEADVVFFTVPDALLYVLPQRFPRDRAGVFVHLSGSLSSRVLPGKGILSMHPLVSIGRRLSSLEGIGWGIEGDEKGVETGKRVIEALGGRYYLLKTEAKPLYHAGCVLCSNLVLTLLIHAKDIFAGLNIPEEEILNLAGSVIENSRLKGLVESLTGPVERGDWDTLREDLLALKKAYPYLFHGILNLVTLNAKVVAEKKGKEYEEGVLRVISDISNFRG